MDNRLFSKNYFSDILKGQWKNKDSQFQQSVEKIFYKTHNFIKKVLDDKYLLNQLHHNETETKSKVIEPLLNLMGYTKEFWFMEKVEVLQGKSDKIDYLVYNNHNSLERFNNSEDCDPYDLLIVEAKYYRLPLDTKRSDQDNPHYQIIRYSNATRIPHGILTNGYTFRFYDNTTRSREKRYYEIDWDDILTFSSAEDFYIYFYGIFSYQTLIKTKDNQQPIYALSKSKMEEHKNSIKERITDILYGTNEEYQSMIEFVGQVLYQRYPQEDLKEIFYHSLIFIFRILFMASYETRYQEILKYHESYEKYSIIHLVDHCIKKDAMNKDGNFLWAELLTIFEYLDQGNERYKIPILNGGLFNVSHAPLLEDSYLFDNQTLWHVLKTLTLDKIEDYSLVTFDRIYDFQSLDTITFGEIYEVSLGYDFRIAEDIIYLVQYTHNNTLITITLDSYDYEMAKKDQLKNFKKIMEYKPGDLYLTSLSGERKQTGSYYTPDIFANFLVKQSIDSHIQSGKNPLDIQLMDNACGSGNFLLRALFYLSWRVQEILAQSQEDTAEQSLIEMAEDIRKTIEIEKIKITDNITRVVSSHNTMLNTILLEETSDEKIIRRLVLKRCIFGVDLQQIATEITMISLWMETFIFATPLSFIEHHIKVGNSLLYTSMREIKTKSELEHGGLFLNDQLEPYRIEIQNLLNEIANMQDTTIEEIKQSKGKFYYEVEPKMVEMRAIFDYFFYEKWISILHKHDPEKETLAPNKYLKENRWEQELLWLKNNGVTLETIKNILISQRETNSDRWNEEILKANGNVLKIRELVVKPEWKNKWDNIQSQYSWFKPFHIEIEFPDVPHGFDIIIGNPPWDKVRFEENSFYNRIDTTYHSQKHDKKLGIRERYVHSEWIQKMYQEEKKITLYNTYLRESFPLARGGQGNLFRYFIARNLELIKPDVGKFSYLTPSAIMMEDASTNLRKHLLENYTMEYFYQFENRGKFKAIHPQFKFSLWQIVNQSPPQYYSIHTRFLENDIRFLSAEDEDWKQDNILYSLHDIKTISPDHWRFLEIKSPQEWNIVKRAQSLFQPLKEEFVSFKQELNMSIDKGLFHQLHLDTSFSPDWQKDDYLPLYEGKMIHQFHAQYAQPTYWVRKQDLEHKLRGRVVQQLKESQPNLTSAQIEEELTQDKCWEYKQMRLAFREIASNTNERTVISSLVPENITFGNTMWETVGSLYQLLLLESIFNSLVFDFLARMIVEIHVTKSIIMRLPCPQPNTQQLQQEPYTTLIKNAAILQVLHNPKIFPEVAKQFEIDVSKLPQTLNAKEKMRDSLRIENDILVAGLYQITPEEMEYILGTLPVFQKKNPHYGKLLVEKFKKTVHR